jgi:hypothetical protein
MYRVLTRLMPLALVLVCLAAGSARAQGPARTLTELDGRAAYARLRDYLNEQPATPAVKTLREQTDCDVSTLFFDHGVPVWLYVPADKGKLDRKLVENSFRALLEQALVKDSEPLLDPGAIPELRAKAHFEEWRGPGDLKDVDDDLVQLWFGSYLREKRPTLAPPLRDRVSLGPDGIRFEDGKLMWIVETPPGKKLSAEEKRLLAENLRGLLVEVLGKHRGGLLGREACQKLRTEVLRGTEWVVERPEPMPVPRTGGAGPGAVLVPVQGGPTPALEEQLRIMRLELTAARQQVRDLQDEVQRLAGCCATGAPRRRPRRISGGHPRPPRKRAGRSASRFGCPPAPACGSTTKCAR